MPIVPVEKILSRPQLTISIYPSHSARAWLARQVVGLPLPISSCARQLSRGGEGLVARRSARIEVAADVFGDGFQFLHRSNQTLKVLRIFRVSFIPSFLFREGLPAA